MQYTDHFVEAICNYDITSRCPTSNLLVGRVLGRPSSYLSSCSPTSPRQCSLLRLQTRYTPSKTGLSPLLKLSSRIRTTSPGISGSILASGGPATRKIVNIYSTTLSIAKGERDPRTFPARGRRSLLRRTIVGR